MEQEIQMNENMRMLLIGDSEDPGYNSQIIATGQNNYVRVPQGQSITNVPSINRIQQAFFHKERAKLKTAGNARQSQIKQH